MPSVKYIQGTPVTDADPLQVQDMAAGPAIAAIGATTDTPFVGAETATARTGISLWKGVKNTLYDALGTAADAIVAVGAVGSISAKLRRVTQGLEDLKTLIVLGAGGNVIGGVNPPLLELVVHPWAKGALTVDGVQYGAEYTTTTDAFEGFDPQTITQPTGYTLYEIELGLTQAIKSSAAVEGVNWKWQASDAGALWTDLIASTLRAASCAAYLDVTCSGRFAPTGNFLGTGATFQIRAAIQSAVAAGETASCKVKSSSYLICRYRRA